MRHFLAPWLLAAMLLPACAPRTPAAGTFPPFWTAFRTAVEEDDAATVAGLTAFPFLFEGDARERDGFEPVYAALFDDEARACLAASRPEPEGDRFVVFCGAILFVFGEAGGAWRFVEFAADPEALEAIGTPAARLELTDAAFEATGQGGGAAHPAGRWRLTGASGAPWAVSAAAGTSPGPEPGDAVGFEHGRVTGPRPLGCDRAAFEFVVTPAEGLFQGNLPYPATATAAAAGVNGLPVLTLAVRCDTGVFDYHFVEIDRLLLGLDDTIWTLAREGPAEGPDAVVLELLAVHMTGDMAFTAAAFQPKRRFLSPALGQRVADYFARSLPSDEPPPINGDPITYSQEYPDRFVLSSGGAAGGRAGGGPSETTRATVPVTFRGGGRERVVRFELVRAAGHWLVDDLRYEDGETLAALLTDG